MSVKEIEMANSEMQILDNFLSIYDPQRIVQDGDVKMILGSKDNRQCRFCNQAAPVVAFANKAHVIPQLLGNRNVTSRFECDSCNDHFSVYESSLAAFVIPATTFAGIRGQKGVQKHNNPRTGLRIELSGERIEIQSRINGGDIDVSKENQTLTIKLTRESYYPLKVFKTLAKIAYCLLDEAELSNFEGVRNLLMSSQYDEKCRQSPLFRMFLTFVPGGRYFKRPSAVLFKRRSYLDDPFYPEKTLVVRFADQTYQIFLCSAGDRELAKLNESFTCVRLPVLMNEHDLKQFGPPQSYIIDLSSPDKKIGEKIEYEWSFSSRRRTDPISEGYVLK